MNIVKLIIYEIRTKRLIKEKKQNCVSMFRESVSGTITEPRQINTRNNEPYDIKHKT